MIESRCSIAAVNSKIGGYCPSGRGNAVFSSQNNMINKSRELVDGTPPPLSHKGYTKNEKT